MLPIPTLKTHPNQLIIYNAFQNSKKNNNEISNELTESRKKSNENLKNNSTNGIISSSAVKRLKRTVSYMLYLNKNENKTINNKITNNCTFITLTLPSKQVHTDKEIKQYLLNQYLIELKNKYNVKNYIWRAEKQSNGNIHFHILVDKNIHYLNVRNDWNRICNKYNYVDVYSTKMHKFHNEGFKFNSNDKRSFAKQKQAYHKGLSENFQNPNSTDIHSLYKIDNVVAYISKYISKKDNQLIEGRIWFCSGHLSEMKGNTEHIDSLITKELESIIKENKLFVTDYAIIINFDIDNYKDTYIYKSFFYYIHKKEFITEKIPPILSDFQKLCQEFEQNTPQCHQLNLF